MAVLQRISYIFGFFHLNEAFEAFLRYVVIQYAILIGIFFCF